MTDEIEFTKRGRKQLRSVIYNEIKEQVDAVIDQLLEPLVMKRVNAKLDQRYNLNNMIERLIKRRIDDIYWSVVEETLRKAEFQETFKNEIIKYLHERWACGSVPFDIQFEKALLKAVKELIR